MTSFAASASLPGLAAPDASKHVNYTLGMILGVDDFTQEFAYLSERDRWLARDVIGYGTVNGLRVEVEEGGAEGQVVAVTPGAAVSPSGQLICVDTTQCARLNDWLDANRPAVEDRIGTEGEATRLALYVVLGYRDRPSDEIPIPGDPCRTEDELTAPSRVADAFHLELALDPPPHREERAIVEFVSWLRAIEVVGDEPGTELDDFIAAIRAAAGLGDVASPPGDSSLEFLHSSPPEALAIPRDRVFEYLKAAFRLWTTELRPPARDAVAGSASFAVGEGESEELLLAELDLGLVWEGRWRTAEGGHVVDDSTRPYVTSLRMVQEWLLAGQDVLTGPPGPQGAAGEPGQSVTEITVGTVAPDVPATAEFEAETGKLHLGIPKGAQGVSVTSVTAQTVPADHSAVATFNQSTGALVLQIPHGPPGSGVDSVETKTLEPGQDASVDYDESTRHLTFNIPRGATGAHVTSVTVTALAPEQNATAEFDPDKGTLKLGVPRGATGPQGKGVTGAGATTVPADQSATAAYNADSGIITFQIPRGPAGPKGDPGPAATLPVVDRWHEIGAAGEPGFENAWRNYGDIWETAGFYKDPWGRVFLKGLIAGGTLDAPAFHLPPGYRPRQAIHLLGNSNMRAADALNVHPDGTVYVRGAVSGVSNLWLSLANTSFRAEQ